MELYDVAVRVGQADLETTENIAVLLADGGIYIEDYADLEAECQRITGAQLIDEQLLARDRTVATVHLYFVPQTDVNARVEQLRARLDAAGVHYELVRSEIDEDFWSEGWKKFYKPTKVGEKLVIVPCWEDYAPKPGEVILSLDPGMAFGTGTHESTQLCLEFLQKVVRGGERLLDVGCGSGILAIGGLLLGAKEACGFDIDPAAIKMSGHNAGLNGLEERLSLKQGGLDDSFGGGFDVACANIVADVIIAILPRLRTLIRPGGSLITSGIITEYAESVIDAAKQNGFSPVGRADKNSWTALLLR